MDVIAEQTARGPGGRKAAGGQFVIFQLGDSDFAVPITLVQEILVVGRITIVPRVPAFIEGVINVRGSVIPVLSLSTRFGIRGRPRGAESRIVVVHVGEQTVGMIVDAVTEVVRLPGEAIEPPPPLITTVSARFLAGIGKLGERVLVILDLDRILSQEEMLALARSGVGGEGARADAGAPLPAA
jgi:purine-binding chemotaxis protein CheW